MKRLHRWARTLGSMALGLALGAAVATPAAAQRYATPPPVTLSPDLSSAWTLQLRRPAVRERRRTRRSPARVRRERRRSHIRRASVRRQQRSIRSRTNARTRARLRPRGQATAVRREPQFSPSLRPRIVDYRTNHKAGTIVVNTTERRLYLVMKGGKAKRYAVGVGKLGFEWVGSHKVTRKAEWPSWTPPKEIIAREAKKGRILPNFMPGGPGNPMGARALYLGSTVYRIHGTNQDWSIGHAVSSGCIRMRNEDVMDLYDKVRVGVRVHVI